MAHFFSLPNGAAVGVLHGSADRPFRFGLWGGGPAGERLQVRLTNPRIGRVAEDLDAERQNNRVFVLTPLGPGLSVVEAVIPPPHRPPPPPRTFPAVPTTFGPLGVPVRPAVVPVPGSPRPPSRPTDYIQEYDRRIREATGRALNPPPPSPPPGTQYAFAQLVVRRDSGQPDGHTVSPDEMALDLLTLALDLAGIVDPTGIADGASAILSVGRGDYLGAAISAVGIIPVLGDLAKTGKLSKHAKTISNAVRMAAKDEAFAKAARPALEQILKRLKQLPMDRLPASAQKELRAIERELEAFLGVGGSARRRYVPNPKHEVAGAGGKRGTRLDLSAADAEALLNHPTACRPVPGKRQFVGVQDGKVYAFQDDGAGGFHAYPVTGQEVTKKYPEVQAWVAELLGTTVKRLANMD